MFTQIVKLQSKAMKLLHLVETEPFEIHKNRDDFWNGDNAIFPAISCGYTSVLSMPFCVQLYCMYF